MNTNVKAVGIWSIGAYLPPAVRKNEHWPEQVVEGWRNKRRQQVSVSRVKLDREDVRSEGARRTMAVMESYGDDVFRGAVERRVMAKDQMPSDMEVAAAEEAIARAGIDRSEIDLLLVYSAVPDQLSVLNAPRVHHRLGLSRGCQSIGVETACNSFMTQFSLADQLIRGGLARRALLVQSTASAHLLALDDQQSVWFGDGATAQIVGPVSDGHGLLGQAHYTDGAFNCALGTCGPGGEKWWQAERQVLAVRDPRQARDMLMKIADVAKESLDAAMSAAGVRPEQVDFYATHQSTAWFRKATAEYAGLSHARTFDTFPWTGSLGACNVPFMMAMGEREGTLRAGDLVAMHSGGSGIQSSGIVMKWGR